MKPDVTRKDGYVKVTFTDKKTGKPLENVTDTINLSIHKGIFQYTHISKDGAITGSQESHQFAGPVTGRLDADGIHLLFRTRYEGTMISYRLDGSVADGRMEGHVTLGSGTDHHTGPLGLAQFGTGRFLGERKGAA